MHVGCNLDPIVLTVNITPIDDSGYYSSLESVYCWQGVNHVWFTSP